ncbi:Uncharacterised protein r2_g1510 [Pycnogonum litorale]
MEDLGIVRRSSSNWSSPLHMVPKRDGAWRPCGDYRALNNITRPDRYPLPHLRDFSNNLHGATIFSKVDLIRAYHQIPVEANHVHKTATITSFGLYEFLRMPFGLKNAAQTFQRFMDQVTRGLTFCFCYLDDLLIASKSPEEHQNHLRLLLSRLQEYGVIINPDKSVFGVPELDFLGHHVSSAGVAPLKDNVKAIHDFPRPKSVTQLRRFLGMVNFYRRFIPKAVNMMQPLYQLLTGKPKKQGSLTWSTASTEAFQATIEALVSATLLVHPQPDAPTAIVTDASETAVGAILQQYIQGEWKPLAFFSKKLSNPETRYSAFDRELLAIYLAVRHFRSFVEGRVFHILTDHKPLTHALRSKGNNRSPRQGRHLSYISEFTHDIRFISGIDNQVADALSRFNVASASANFVDSQELAAAQDEDETLSQLLKSPSALNLQKVKDDLSGESVFCDLSTGIPRPYVPLPQRPIVFAKLHSLSHPGIRATRRMIAKRYVWPSMNKDIATWCKTCLRCQSAKVQRHTATKPGTYPLPTVRFSNVHLDLVGPLPSSHGFQYLLTCIDRYTRWPEVIPLTSITAIEVARAFISGWVARFGIPATIVTDRGRQFESNLWTQLNQMLGIRHFKTCAYSPATNGIIERLHRQLKSSLMTYNDPANWLEHLPMVLLGIRTSVKEDLKATTAEMVYGSQLRLPGQLIISVPAEIVDPTSFVSRLKNSMQSLRPTAPRSRDTKSIFYPADLNDCTHVFVRCDAVRKPLQPPYDGPFMVLKRNPKRFTLQLHGRKDTVSVDRLKPAHLDSAATTATPEQTSNTPAQLTSADPAKPMTRPSILKKGPQKETITRSGRRVHFPARYR